RSSTGSCPSCSSASVSSSSSSPAPSPTSPHCSDTSTGPTQKRWARTISDTPRVATTTGIRRVVSGASPRGAREGAERRELWGRLCLGAGCAKVPHEGPDAGRGPREEAEDDRSHEREPRQIEAGALGSWERQDDARCHDEVVLDEPLPCGGP